MNEERNKMISIVTPCYYCEKTIKSVVDDVVREIAPIHDDYEIILVNDGSRDNSLEVLKQIADENSHVKVIDLGKNYGQASALMCGYNHCNGDVIVTLDDDGQNDPKEVKKMIEKLDEGYDAVFADYIEKKDTLFKKWGHDINNTMAHIMLKKPNGLELNHFFVMNRYICDEIIKYKGPYPYVWGLILRCSDKLANVRVEHKERKIGHSTYTVKKLISLWINGFTSFSIIPLRVSSLLGIIMSCFGLLYGIFLIVKFISGEIAVQGWMSTTSIILVLGGVQLIMIGMLGEYVGRIFLTDNKEPQYSVRNIYGKDK
ncbi:MAG: glycosyltransferase family 2 protein [Clostridium sp.]|nr:glycosyltransferase family 2 protein [Clostridium sp.]